MAQRKRRGGGSSSLSLHAPKSLMSWMHGAVVALAISIGIVFAIQNFSGRARAAQRNTPAATPLNVGMQNMSDMRRFPGVYPLGCMNHRAPGDAPARDGATTTAPRTGLRGALRTGSANSEKSLDDFERDVRRLEPKPEAPGGGGGSSAMDKQFARAGGSVTYDDLRRSHRKSHNPALDENINHHRPKDLRLHYTGTSDQVVDPEYGVPNLTVPLSEVASQALRNQARKAERRVRGAAEMMQGAADMLGA